MTGRRSHLLLGAAAAALLFAPAAHAQDDRRLRDLEKQVRELRAIVFQGRDTGQPVIVKPEGPDPQVTALQQRSDQQDQQIRDLTGRIEVLNHDVEEAKGATTQARTDAEAQRQALSDRISRVEGELTAVAAPPPAAAPGDPTLAPPAAAPPAAAAPGAAAAPALRGGALTARVQSQDTGTLGGASGPAATPPPSAPADSYEGAMASYKAGDYASAAGGFQAYATAHPSGAKGQEARYYLGQSLYARATYPEAARAYAEALKGWPKAGWAPDATVKLAQALVQLDRAPSACQALAEYARRYAGSAPAAVKVRATAIRSRAQCGAG